MKRILLNRWVIGILAVTGVLLALQYLVPTGEYEEISTSRMIEYIEDGEVSEITFIDGDQVIEATLDDGVERDGGNQVMTYWLTDTQAEIETQVEDQIASGDIDEYTTEVSSPSLLGTILGTFLPLILIFVVFLWLMNNMQGGGGRGVMQFAKSKAKLVSKDMPKTTFSDVAGCNEAIEELGEIKEFLQEPAKFQAVGAKIPKGVLLYGPPGTGKTLLARAVAGKAGGKSVV